MKKIFKTGALACFLVGSVVQATEVPVTSLTKNCKPLINKNLKIPQPPIQGLDERTHKRMTRAQERMAEGKYDEGIELLKKLIDSARNDYVRATTYLQLGYANSQAGRQDESYPHFIQALKFGEQTLPHSRVQSLRENVAGFMYVNGDKQKAIKLMEEWMKKSNVENANAFYLLGAMYADPDINRLREAICLGKFAAETAEKPSKTYFQLMLAAHWELKDEIGTAELLKKMLEYFPDENNYWRQLSSIYLQLDKPKDSLAILEMFYLRGLFENENDYKSLSSLFGYEEVPYRAAQILEEGIKKGVVKPEEKNWRTIAQNYHVSNELNKAIMAYGKTAEIASDGKDYLKQAELYSDKEQWRDAVNAFDSALSKGGLDDTGRAYLRKGVALISMGRCSNAVKVLNQASKYKKHRNSSVQWTNYARDRMRRKKC